MGGGQTNRDTGGARGGLRQASVSDDRRKWFKASSNRSGSARQLAGKAGSGDLCSRWDGGRRDTVLEVKLHKNKLLRRSFLLYIKKTLSQEFIEHTGQIILFFFELRNFLCRDNFHQGGQTKCKAAVKQRFN